MDLITQCEVSAVLKQLQTILTNSASLFNTPSSKYPMRYSTTSSNLNAMTGIVTLQEDMLCHMEVLIKTTKVSPMLKATFREDKQWKLQQIQDSVNHLKMAANALNLFMLSQNSGTSTPEHIICLLDNITKSVNLCRMRLFSPCKLSLEALVTSGIVKMFTPSLPGETIVNLFILEDRLVMTHYTVQLSHSNLSKNSRSTRTPMLFHPVGTVLEHAGARYEVATAHKAECHIPWLTQMLEATELSLQLSYELKRKLAFSVKR